MMKEFLYQDVDPFGIGRLAGAEKKLAAANRLIRRPASHLRFAEHQRDFRQVSLAALEVKQPSVVKECAAPPRPQRALEGAGKCG